MVFKFGYDSIRQLGRDDYRRLYDFAWDSYYEIFGIYRRLTGGRCILCDTERCLIGRTHVRKIKRELGKQGIEIKSVRRKIHHVIAMVIQENSGFRIYQDVVKKWISTIEGKKRLSDGTFEGSRHYVTKASEYHRRKGMKSPYSSLCDLCVHLYGKIFGYNPETLDSWQTM